jgi:hypothetical protein
MTWDRYSVGDWAAWMMLEEGVMAYIGGLGGPVGLLSMFEIGARPLEGVVDRRMEC